MTRSLLLSRGSRLRGPVIGAALLLGLVALGLEERDRRREIATVHDRIARLAAARERLAALDRRRDELLAGETRRIGFARSPEEEPARAAHRILAAIAGAHGAGLRDLRGRDPVRLGGDLVRVDLTATLDVPPEAVLRLLRDLDRDRGGIALAGLELRAGDAPGAPLRLTGEIRLLVAGTEDGP